MVIAPIDRESRRTVATVGGRIATVRRTVVGMSDRYQRICYSVCISILIATTGTNSGARFILLRAHG